MAGAVRLALSFALASALGCYPLEDPTTFSAGEPADPPFAASSAAPDAGAASETSAAPAALVLDDEESAALDPRPSRLLPRESSVILAEMRALGSRRAGAGTPDKAAAVRRVAEDYVELAASAERAPVPFVQRGRPYDQQLRQAMTRGQREIAATARTTAIAIYEMLLRAPFDPPYSARDEVRYYQAIEYARAGKADDAKRAALEVLAKTHRSVWADRARYLLGVLLENDPGKRVLAATELADASHGSDPTIARLALRRLGVREAPREVAAAPPPPARELTAPPSPVTATCTMDMECDGASVCRNGACVGMP